MRSNVFNGTQPSNDGDILTDCDQGFNGGDYSDLSNTFAWNRTTSVDQQVSIVFRFDQQINISRISMIFWNSPSNSLIVPDVTLAWGDHNMVFIPVTAITTNSPNRTEDGQAILSIGINNDRLKFVYLRITMAFYSNSEWIFLGEVQFCGELSTVVIVIMVMHRNGHSHTDTKERVPINQLLSLLMTKFTNW